jgi:uncharacterized membrane protein YgcG
MSGSDFGSQLRGLGRFAFGDRLGLVIWLGLAVSYAFLWRLDLAITDSNVFANMLVSLADGSMAVTEIRFPLDTLGAQRVQQGLIEHDGAYYGRNYGQVALAVPVLWALEAVAAIVDVRLMLAGGWSLLLLGFVHHLGVILEAPRRGRVVGAVLAGLAFASSMAVGTDVDPRMLPVIALQLVNLGATAAVALILYRLVGRFHGRRVGGAAGLAAGLATPVAFWATFPKRHVLVTLVLLAGLLSFVVSRQTETGSKWARGGAYAAFGSIAWVHAFEGFVLVLALGVVEFTTAARTDRRSMAIIGLCLLVALAPTLATNAAVTGDPLKPPRLGGSGDLGSDLLRMQEDGRDAAGDDEETVQSTDGENEQASGGDGDAGGESDGDVGGESDGGAGGGSSDGIAVIGPLIGLLPASARSALGLSVDLAIEGVWMINEPDKLWHTFVRSGNYDQFLVWNPPYQPYELSVIESMPLLAGLVGLPLAGLERVRKRVRGEGNGSLRPTTARGQTDLLVAVVATTLTVVYLSRLPLQGQLTVRYLLFLYPLGIYGLVRYRPIRRTITAAPRALVGGATVGLVATLLGGMVVLASIDPARAEAVQAHALVHLGLALGLVAVLVVSALTAERDRRGLALVLGLVAGTTCGYYALAGLEYFSGTYALDLARTTADLITIL